MALGQTTILNLKRETGRGFGFGLFFKMKKENYILVIGIILCGVISSPYVLDPSLIVRHIVLGITALALCWFLFLKKKKNLSILQTSIFLVFLIYCVITTLSLFKAVNKSESLYAVLTAWTTFILFFCIAVTSDKKIIIKALVYFGLFMALYSSYDVILAYMSDQGIRATKSLGFTNGRNLWSSTLMLLLPFSLYSVVKDKNKIAALGLVLLTLNIMFLQTRSVYLSLFLATIVGLFYYKKKYAIIFCLIIVCYVLSYERLRTTGSLGYRLQSWNRTIKTFCDAPILGNGAGSWKIAAPKYGNQFGSRLQHHQRAHNDFLEVFSDIGLLGGLSYIAIFALGIHYTRRARDKILAWTMLFGIICYMVFAFFSFPKERALHTILVMTMIGLVVKEYPMRKQWYGRNYKILTFCTLIIFSALFINCHRYKAEVYSKKFLIATNYQNWPKVIKIIDDNYSLYATMVGYSVTPILYYRAVAHYHLRHSEKSFEDFLDSHKNHPNHASTLYNLGYYHSREKNYKQALHYYEIAEKIYPAEFVIAKTEKIRKMVKNGNY